MNERDLQALREADADLYAERVLRIVDEQKRLVPLVYRPAQHKVWAEIKRQRARGPVRVNVGKSRKTGVSTAIQGIGLQDLTLNPNREGLVVAHDRKTAGKLFNIAMTMYANLPDDPVLRPPIAHLQDSMDRKSVRWGDRIGFIRGLRDRGLNSMLEIDTAQEVGGGRGATPNFLHCSEIAHWPNAEKALALLNSVPDVPGTTIICESTANSFNFWKDHWDRADRHEGRFRNVFISWLEDPQCREEFESAEHRASFVTEIGRKGPKDVIKDEGWLMEKLGATAEQLYWRRLTISDKANGDVDWFKQEYPACLTAETRVSTERGIVPIGEAVGAKRTESGPILRWGPQPESVIYRLTTKQGRVIRGTFDHPVQTDAGLVGIRDLETGARIELRSPMFAERQYMESWEGPFRSLHSVRVTPDLGRFIGFYMGDGSWHKDTLSFACDGKDLDVVDDLTRLTTHFIGRPTPRTIQPIKGRRGCIELRIGSKPAREFMKRLGLIALPKGGGSYRREVCVPECIWRSPRPVVREFLRGLFEADGSASANKVRFATSHERFARDVQLLLLGFGLNVPIVKAVKWNGTNEYTNWTMSLCVADSKVFHDEIGFVGARKSALRPKEQADGRPSRSRDLCDWVESVEIDGYEVTYDFTLNNEEHLFSAAGILTHNTADEMFVGSGKHVFAPRLQRSAIESAEHFDPQGVEGTLTASGFTQRWQPNGHTEVPTGALWVPSRALGEQAELWKLWLPTEHDEPPTPAADRQFVMAVDPAGTNATTIGADPDSWAIQVIDHLTLEQVAAWQGRLDTDLIAEQVFLAYLFFNEALTAVEVTGGWGVPLVDDQLSKRYGHRRLFRRQKLLYAKDQSAGESAQTALGWSTNRQTKPQLIEGMRELLREETHGIKHLHTALQLRTFVWNESTSGSKTAGASESAHDDLLMAYMIAQQVARLVRPRPKQKPRVSSSVPRNLRH